QLQADITYRRSVLLRLQGDVEASDRSIQTFLSNLGSEVMLAPEDLARLCLSQAINHAYHLRFEGAAGELLRVRRWLTDENCSLLWDHMLCVGRLKRRTGEFPAAKTCFELCLRSAGLPEPKLLLVKSALADVYCEMDELSKGGSYLSWADDLVRPEIQRLKKSCAPSSKGFRRLLMSLLEIKIKSDKHAEAGPMVKELLDIYAQLREPDIVDRLGHIRTLIAHARLAPSLEEAVRRWNDVIQLGTSYYPSDTDVFMCGVVYLHLYLAKYQQGFVDESRETLRRAMDVLGRNRRQFLIPGVETYLYHSVRSRVQSTTVW
ncbi:hypothetical protein GE09DRAFT_911368, partial [Coniochaeta sp. 2T2.1]